MRTLAVWTRKGGAGKSTLVACLGAFGQESERIVLVDADPQGSLSSWSRLRTAEAPAVATASLLRLGEVLEAARSDGYDVAIIDLPGALGPGEVRALALVDVAVIPARPSPFDLAATLASVEVARSVHCAAVVVLSQVRARGREADEMRSALSAHVPVLEPDIGERVAFPNAISLGLGVTENEPRGAAADEIRAVFNALRRVLDGKA